MFNSSIRSSIGGSMTAMSRRFRTLLFITMSLSGMLVFKPPVHDILLSAIILYWFTFKKAELPRNLVFAIGAIVAYAAWYWFSVTQATVVSKALWYACLTTFCGAMFVFFVSVLHKFGLPAFHLIMKGWAATSVAGVIFALAVYVTPFPGREEFLYNGRPKGLFVDANVFGPSLVPVLIYSFSQVLTSSKVGSALLKWGLVSLITGAGVFMSFSRAAWINALISLALFLMLTAIFARSSGFMLKRIAVVTIVIALCSGCLYLAFSSQEDFVSIAQKRSKLQDYDDERFSNHHRALALAANRWVLGIGPAQYVETYGIATHEVLLHISAEDGIPATIAFVSFLMLTLSTSIVQLIRASTLDARVYFASVTALLVGAFVNSAVIDTLHWRHFWLLCAFAWPSYAARQTARSIQIKRLCLMQLLISRHPKPVLN